MGLDICVRKIKHKADISKDLQYYADDYSYISLYDTNNDGSIITPNFRNIPKWALKMAETKSEKFPDWDKLKSINGFDINEYDFLLMSSNDNNEYIAEFENKKSKKKYYCLVDSIPPKYVDVKVIYYEKYDIGYMRRGMNKNFYKDAESGIVKDYVWEKDELYKILDKYVENDSKELFTKNIINTFKDGETVAIFSW